MMHIFKANQNKFTTTSALPKSFLLIVVILFLLLSATTILYSMTKKPMSLPMNIYLKKQSYNLGEPIPVDIVYRNNSSKEKSLDDPSNSLNVSIHMVDEKNKEDFNYSMGQATTTIFNEDEDQYAVEIPIQKSITIAPMSSYQFQSDLNKRLFLRPGTFDCFLTDGDSQSEHKKITIIFKEPALSYLIAFAMDEKQEYSRREWAMEWIQEVNPAFVLKLPNENTPNNTAKEYERFNQQRYKEFVLWRKSKTSNL